MDILLPKLYRPRGGAARVTETPAAALARADKVSRRLTFGRRRLCTLLLDSAGLYIINTGEVAALRFYLDADGSPVGHPSVEGLADARVRALVVAEARIDATPLATLARERGNRFVARGEIVRVSLRAGAARLDIWTARERHVFRFPMDATDQAATFARALGAGE